MNHKYSFHCVWSNEDEAFIACVPELPGCKADGATALEALKALDVVIGQWLETAKEQGRPIPEPLSTEDYETLSKKFREQLAEHVKREVETAVQRVIKDISKFNPVLTGGRDPADYWKQC
jgi:predicted RNase H-like HicB family nuclease